MYFWTTKIIIMKTRLSETDTELVQQSFARILSKSQPVGERFYANLFSLYAETQHLFKTNTTAQAEKFITMLSYIVSCLDNIEELDNVLLQLGKRHSAYKVNTTHYVPVREALLVTLREYVGETNETENTISAWGHFYDLIAEKMLAYQPS